MTQPSNASQPASRSSPEALRVSCDQFIQGSPVSRFCAARQDGASEVSPGKNSSRLILPSSGPRGNSSGKVSCSPVPDSRQSSRLNPAGAGLCLNSRRGLSEPASSHPDHKKTVRAKPYKCRNYYHIIISRDSPFSTTCKQNSVTH